MATANFKSLDDEDLRQGIALCESAAVSECSRLLRELDRLAKTITAADNELRARGATDLRGNRVRDLCNTIQGINTGDLDATANTALDKFVELSSKADSSNKGAVALDISSSGAGHLDSSPAPFPQLDSSPPAAFHHDSAQDAEGDFDNDVFEAAELGKQQFEPITSDLTAIPDTAPDSINKVWKQVDKSTKSKGKKARSVAESMIIGRDTGQTQYSTYQKQLIDPTTKLSVGTWKPTRKPGSQNGRHGSPAMPGFNCPCNISDDADNGQMIQCTNYDFHDPSGQRQGGWWHKICVNLWDEKTGIFETPQNWQCHKCGPPKTRLPGFQQPRSYGEMRIFWSYEAWRAYEDFGTGHRLEQNDGIWKWMSQSLLDDFGIKREPSALRTYQHHTITGSVEGRGNQNTPHDSRSKGMLKCFRNLFVNHGIGHLANIFMKYNAGVYYRLPVEDQSLEAQKTLTPTTQKEDDAIVRSNIKQAEKAASRAANPPKQSRSRRNTKRSSTTASTPLMPPMPQSPPSGSAMSRTPMTAANAAHLMQATQDMQSIQHPQAVHQPQSVQQPYSMQPMHSMQSAQYPTQMQYGQPVHFPLAPNLPQYPSNHMNAYGPFFQSFTQVQSPALSPVEPRHILPSQKETSPNNVLLSQLYELPQKVKPGSIPQQSQHFIQPTPQVQRASTIPHPPASQAPSTAPAAVLPSQSDQSPEPEIARLDKGKGRKRPSPEPEHPSTPEPKRVKTPPLPAAAFAPGYGEAGPSSYYPTEKVAAVMPSNDAILDAAGSAYPPGILTATSSEFEALMSGLAPIPDQPSTMPATVNLADIEGSANISSIAPDLINLESTGTSADYIERIDTEHIDIESAGQTAVDDGFVHIDLPSDGLSGSGGLFTGTDFEEWDNDWSGLVSFDGN